MGATSAKSQHLPAGYLFGALIHLYWGGLWYSYSLGRRFSITGAIVLFIVLLVILGIATAIRGLQPAIRRFIQDGEWIETKEEDQYDHRVLGVMEFLVFLASLIVLWRLVDWRYPIPHRLASSSS